MADQVANPPPQELRQGDALVGERILSYPQHWICFLCFKKSRKYKVHIAAHYKRLHLCEVEVGSRYIYRRY